MQERVPDSSELRELLRGTGEAVLALASGGCARYLLSARVPLAVDPAGRLYVVYDSRNPYLHELMSHSHMTLRLLVEADRDGLECSHLVFSGDLHADGVAGPDGARRYEFRASTAHLEFASGRRVALHTDTLTRI